MPEPRDRLLTAYLQQRKALHRFLVRRTGCSEAASDLVQDVWVRLIQAAQEAAVDNPRAYLFRIAANLVLDLRRAETRRPAAEEGDLLLALPDEAPGPEAAVAARRQLYSLQAALRDLPDRRRRIFLLSRLDGVPHRVIAAELGISVRSVEKDLRKALDHCAARLGRS